MIRELIAFLEAPAAVSFNLPPEEAIEFFKAKGLRTSFSFRDISASEHSATFTVAKMMDVDLLGEVQASLTAALEQGIPFDQWRRQLMPTLQARGWWGREDMTDPLTGERVNAALGSASRLKTIFRTNLQSAYHAGKWQQIEEQKEDAPYLLYDAVDDFRTRPEHAAWDDRVYPVDDPFWEAHYPPNGYNCRCSAIQISEEELSELGLDVSPPFAGPVDSWTNPRTGAVERVPRGVDPSFAINAGIQRLDVLRKLLSEKAGALGGELAGAAATGIQAAEEAASAAAAADVVEEFDSAPIPEYVPAATFEDAWEYTERLVESQGAVKYQTVQLVPGGPQVPAVRFDLYGSANKDVTRKQKLGAVNLAGIPNVETANTINEWLQGAQRECDRLGIPRIRGITTQCSPQAGASMGDGVLALNPKYTEANPPEKHKQYRAEVINNHPQSKWKASDGNLGKRFHSAGHYFADQRDALINTLWHEFGHHIHQQLSVTNADDYFNPPLEKALADIYGLGVFRGRKLTQKSRFRSGKLLVFPSEYAKKNAAEYFAECYSLFKAGKLDKLQPEMIALLEEVDRGRIPRG